MVMRPLLAVLVAFAFSTVVAQSNRGGTYDDSGGTYRVGQGTYLAAAFKAPAQESPVLQSFNYSFSGTACNLTNINWVPNGKVRFFFDATAGADVTTPWTVEGVHQALLATQTLVVGVEYTLYYQIDPIPDYPGWDEGTWLTTGLTWTQPPKAAPIDGDYQS